MSFFLVPFTLHVKLSESCTSLHEELGALLSLLPREEGSSPSTSPTTLCAEANRDILRRLLSTSPVVPLHTVDGKKDGAAIADFIATVRCKDACEQAYVRILFQEYCKRKSIEKESETAWADCKRELKRLQDAELPSEFMSLNVITEQESTARDEVLLSYNRFVEWLKKTLRTEIPGGENTSLSEQGKDFPTSGCVEDGSSNKNGVEGEARVDTDMKLRRQAISMIEHEYEHHRRARDAQVEALRQQEEQLLRQIDERKRIQEAEQQKRHVEEMELQYRGLLERENSIRERLSQQEDALARREEDQCQLLQHIEAEEELLLHRLGERERQRREAEEEKERMEREQRGQLYEHVEAEEELLRQRLRRWEEARLAEAAEVERRAREQREELYEHVRAEEEILRRRLEQRKKLDAEKAESRTRHEEEEEERERQRQGEGLLEDLVAQTFALEERLRHREVVEKRQEEQLDQQKREMQLQRLYEMENNQHYLRLIQQQQQQQQWQRRQQVSSSVGDYLHHPMASAVPPAESMRAVPPALDCQQLYAHHQHPQYHHYYQYHHQQHQHQH